MQYGEQIKKLRKKRGMSQSEFAKVLGISQVSVSKIESNTLSPGREVLEKIAEKLEIPLSIIIIESTEEKDIHESKRNLWSKFLKSNQKIINKLN